MKHALLILLLLFTLGNGFAQPVNPEIDSLVNAYNRINQFNGVVLAGRNGSIIYQKAFGYLNFEKKIANDVNSVFQIGSLTKQFTSAVIMQLVEEGKLSVQDPLTKYFPGFPNGEKITVHHLLTHTSGIANYTDAPEFRKRDDTQPI